MHLGTWSTNPALDVAGRRRAQRSPFYPFPRMHLYNPNRDARLSHGFRSYHLGPDDFVLPHVTAIRPAIKEAVVKINALYI